MEEPARTTYFLGAGASAAVMNRAPLTATLLDDVLKPNLKGTSPGDVHLVRELVAFLAGDGAGAQRPFIDDVVAVVDAALTENLPLSARWTVARLAEARASLDRLVYDCVNKTVHERLPESQLLDLLLRRCRKSGLVDVIVSLNWDCLIERAFAREFNYDASTIDYGILCSDVDGRPRSIQDGALRVLKPHGSLSWGYCPLCGMLIADISKPFQFSKGTSVCPHCVGVPLRFVLVPPGLSMNRPWFLPALWDQVEAAVRTSARLVFIGYSFPLQDVDVRVHLLRAVAQRDSAHKPLSIEVVTKRITARRRGGAVERNRAKDQRGCLTDPEERRYRSLLGGHTITFFTRGFSEWIAKERM